MKKRHVEEKIIAGVLRLFNFHKKRLIYNILQDKVCTFNANERKIHLAASNGIQEQTQASVVFLKKNSGSTYHFRQK
jgi:hypothetical protein